MASLRRCVRSALLLGVPLAAWTVSAVEHEEAGAAVAGGAFALSADDECLLDGGSAEVCGLSALQRRAVASGGRHLGEDKDKDDDDKEGSDPEDDDDDEKDQSRRRRRRRRSTDTTTTAAAAAKDEDVNATATQGPTEAPAWGTCGGERYTGPTKCVAGYMCVHLTQYYAQCKPAEEKDWDPYVGSAVLNKTSEAPLMTFYVYRASGTNQYPPMNVNAADLGGLMWYMHNEVVSCVYDDCQQARRFGISRIMRYKVQTKAPEPLYKAGMNFGIRYAFDSGLCTGPWVCEDQFSKYGYFVGCNSLSSGFPFPTWPVYYPGTWFSFPGSCPTKKHDQQSMECREDQPGGKCDGPPTGTGTCTYSAEFSGEIQLDDLVGIVDYTAFKESGGQEFNLTLDEGVSMTFWNHMNNTDANAKRVKAANDLFKKKYPALPSDEEYQPPVCDFDKAKFFPDGLPTELNKNNPQNPLVHPMQK